MSEMTQNIDLIQLGKDLSYDRTPEDMAALEILMAFKGGKLNARERYVVWRTIAGTTYAQIGREMGRSRGRITQIYHKTIRKMRHPYIDEAWRLPDEELIFHDKSRTFDGMFPLPPDLRHTRKRPPRVI